MTLKPIESNNPEAQTQADATIINETDSTIQTETVETNQTIPQSRMGNPSVSGSHGADTPTPSQGPLRVYEFVVVADDVETHETTLTSDTDTVISDEVDSETQVQKMLAARNAPQSNIDHTSPKTIAERREEQIRSRRSELTSMLLGIAGVNNIDAELFVSYAISLGGFIDLNNSDDLHTIALAHGYIRDGVDINTVKKPWTQEVMHQIQTNFERFWNKEDQPDGLEAKLDMLYSNVNSWNVASGGLQVITNQSKGKCSEKPIRRTFIVSSEIETMEREWTGGHRILDNDAEIYYSMKLRRPEHRFEAMREIPSSDWEVFYHVERKQRMILELLVPDFMFLEFTEAIKVNMLAVDVLKIYYKIVFGVHYDASAIQDEYTRKARLIGGLMGYDMWICLKWPNVDAWF